LRKYIEIPSDMLIILTWIIATFVFIVIPELSDTIIRTILGIPMVLFIPGYVLITVLFPKKDDLETIERIALSFGLSIAVVPLIGLGLNFTPFGIRLIPILISLCIYAIILIYVAIYRRRKLPEDDQFSVQFHNIYDIVNKEIDVQNRTDKILTVILIFSIILALGALIYVVTVPKIGEKFTEFYILGPEGKADNYPTELKLNSSTTLMTGLVNHEYSLVNYTIQIILDKDVLLSEKLMLNHNETWQNNMTFVPDKVGNDEKLELLLFKENNFTVPYRELHLWVNTTI
jgi:uncharacterized membrane protein